LARARNLKKNCRLFTYEDICFSEEINVGKDLCHKKNNIPITGKLQSKSSSTLKIAGWNIRSLKFDCEEDYRKNVNLSPNDKRPLLIKEVKRLNIDILCLSEVHLLGNDNIEFEGYVLLWSGHDKKHQNGVAILLKKELARGINIGRDVKFVSDRIMTITLLIKAEYICIISAYAPTNTYQIEQKLNSTTNFKKLQNLFRKSILS